MAAQVVPLQSRPLREKAKASNQARNLRLKVKGHLGWRKKWLRVFCAIWHGTCWAFETMIFRVGWEIFGHGSEISYILMSWGMGPMGWCSQERMWSNPWTLGLGNKSKWMLRVTPIQGLLHIRLAFICIHLANGLVAKTDQTSLFFHSQEVPDRDQIRKRIMKMQTWPSWLNATFKE